jgi:hypothetical protein
VRESSCPRFPIHGFLLVPLFVPVLCNLWTFVLAQESHDQYNRYLVSCQRLDSQTF